MLRNVLAKCRSPYLLLHKANPFQWQTWGKEAFEQAKLLNKPIFLSIGYSSCHWCHVMSAHVFENPDIAAIANEHQVNIKMDREEHPHLDQIYQAYLTARGGRGGWPLSVWLTPDLKPIFAHTYIPPEPFKELVVKIHELFEANPESLEREGSALLNAIASSGHSSSAERSNLPNSHLLSLREDMEELTAQRFDPVWGGFESAPKFPTPPLLEFLSHRGTDTTRAMLHTTIKSIVSGGIHDHIGGGFHRYSVDELWHVPHFEKMLYDQAQLLPLLAECFRDSKEPEYLDAATKTYEYVLRCLRAPTGAFWCAECADSPLEITSDDDIAMCSLDGTCSGGGKNIEGGHYIWEEAAVSEALLELFRDDADFKVLQQGKAFAPGILAAFEKMYGVKPDGNTTRSPQSDPMGELQGMNVLYMAAPLEEALEELRAACDGSLSDQDARRLVGLMQEKLLQVRSRRPQPLLDDKVLTSWNGLMVAGLSRAAVSLNASGAKGLAGKMLQTAEDGVRWIVDNFASDAGLLHTEGIAGLAQDYSFLIDALLQLQQAELAVLGRCNAEYIQAALRLQGELDSKFWDGGKDGSLGGGYFETAQDQADAVVRLKSLFDGAEPSTVGKAAMNLTTLACLFEGTPEAEEWKKKALLTIASLEKRLHTTPIGNPLALVAFSDIADGLEVVVLKEAAALSEISPSHQRVVVLESGLFEDTVWAAKLGPAAAAVFKWSVNSQGESKVDAVSEGLEKIQGV